jgi:hypothetical protein
VAAISGRAGSIASIDSAMVAKSIAIRPMNSVWEPCGGVWVGNGHAWPRRSAITFAQRSVGCAPETT